VAHPHSNGPIVAVVGTGSMGLRHLRALGAAGAVNVIAIPSRLERLTVLSAAGHATAPSIAEAARRGAAFCIVASDTSRHVQDGLEAVRQGLHVLVEKPLARHAAEAAVLVRAAADAGRGCYVGCTLRFAEALNLFRARLPELGSVHDVRIEAQSYLPAWRPDRNFRVSYSARADEGGVLRDLIHEVDYAGWLFGWPLSVSAKLRNHGHLGIASEEAADLFWDAPFGPTVSIRLDYLTVPTRRRLRASGANGTLEWDAVAGSVAMTSADGTLETTQASQCRDAMVAAQAIAFIAACGGHADDRLATGTDGLRALAVCDAARESSATGRDQLIRHVSPCATSPV